MTDEKRTLEKVAADHWGDGCGACGERDEWNSGGWFSLGGALMCRSCAEAVCDDPDLSFRMPDEDEDEE